MSVNSKLGPETLPWTALGRFYKGNLHCHSTLSDGKLPLGTVVNIYREQEYDFLAVTEHRLIADTRWFDNEGFVTIPGTELDQPVQPGGPHRYINALGLPHHFPLDARDESLPEIARRARDAGAFVAIACPAWCGTTTDDVLAVGAAHAVETYNETCELANARGSSWHLVDEAADRGVRLLGLAVDDAHFHAMDGLAAWVEVKTERLTPSVIVDALKRGHYYHSTGPKILDLKVSDDAVSITTSPVRSIMLSGLLSSGAAEHGYGLTTATFPLNHFRPGYFRVTITDHTGKRAWSNPVWLDTDTTDTTERR